MSLRFQRLFLTFPEGLHSVPELSPKGASSVQFEMLGFVVPVNTQLIRTQQMHVTNTPYIYIHTHLVLFSFLFLLYKIPPQDSVLADIGLSIVLAGWEETKNNFVLRLQVIREVTCQSSL